MAEAQKFLDEDELLAVFAALDAPLYLDPSNPANVEFIADLQDEAHAMVADILGFDVE